MNASARSACWGLLAIFAPLAAAPQSAADGDASYDVERTQSMQDAPAGAVGRKTTDREHRVGTGEETLGNESTYVLTFGGFARRCPTSEGIVRGDFEYSIVYDGTETGDDGVIRREHHARRLIAQLEGHVGDDAKLEYVELTGAFTIDRNGTDLQPTSVRRPVQTRFTPGGSGEPDLPAMSAAVEMTADIAVASVILMAGTLYREAELEWSKIDECVEFSFDPPTDTEVLGSNQSKDVRFELRSKEDGAPVTWRSENIGAIGGVGMVAPRRVESAENPAVTLTYTASERPRRGHGIDAVATSRAGVANGKWRIVDRYEGTFSQVARTNGSLSVLSSNVVETLTGRLVWSPKNTGTPAPSFGDVASTFYVPTEGDITIELSSVNANSAGGASCETQGRRTFGLAELPPSALQYLLLEIAADGRYRLVLGIPDFPQTTWEAEGVCRFPGAGSRRQTVPAALPAVEIGIQQGTLDGERAVVGEMPAQTRGPRTTTGNWSFKLVQ